MSTTKARYIRYRSFDRLKHSTNFLNFLDSEASRLAGTGAGKTLTPVNASNSFTAVGHGYDNGEGPIRMKNSGGALPTGVAADTDYWVSVVDVDNFKIHASLADALVPQNEVAFTDDGTGTQTSHDGATAEGIFNAMLAGKSADEIRGLTNLDNL